MANQKVSDLTGLAEPPASDDVLYVVDTSATASKKVQNKYIIQTDKISLNNSQVIALDDGGTAGEFQVLVAAPGSGYMVVPLTVTFISTGAGSTQSNRKALYIGYDVDQTDDFWVEYTYFMDGLASGDVVTLTGEAGSGSARSSADSSIDNLALSVWSSGNFDGGWAVDIYITYQIVKL